MSINLHTLYTYRLNLAELGGSASQNPSGVALAVGQFTSFHVISSVHDLTRSFRFRYIQCSGANVHWTATAFWIFFTAIGWPVPKKSVVLRATATSATCCKCFKQFDMWQDATLKWRLQTASKTQCQQEITTGCGLNMLQWCWTMLNEQVALAACYGLMAIGCQAATSATCCKCLQQDATLKWRLQTASKTQCQQEITTGCGLNMLQWCWTMLNE